MTSLKQASIEVINSLPESCSLEEIMYEINLTAQVLAGLSDEEQKKTITTSELLKNWSEKTYICIRCYIKPI